VLDKRTAAMDDEMLTYFYGMDRRGWIVFKIIGTLMPWERCRLSRLADVCTETELMSLDQPAETEFTLTTRTGTRIIVAEEEIWDDGMGMAMGGMAEAGFVDEDMIPMKPKLVRTEPFLWSRGEQVRYVPEIARGALGSPLVSDFQDPQGRTLTEQDLLNQGLRYPIPTVQKPPSDSSDDADAAASR